MKKLLIDLEHCYGIKKLKAEFDFSTGRVYAIYAPNGVMKSSLAQTFRDVADGAISKDRIFPARANNRKITDEKGVDLPKTAVFVVRPYDGTLAHSEKTSTLLINDPLKREYDKIHVEIDKARELLLTALKNQSGSKKDLEKEISSTFTSSDNEFYTALIRIKEELRAQTDAPFADVRYDTIFDDKVMGFLGTNDDVKAAIEGYVRKYNELLAASTFFKKGVFDYYNAGQIAQSLAKNGFFRATHTVRLNANNAAAKEIRNEKELAALIANEQQAILKDKELRKKFGELDKLMTRNVDLRNCSAYLAENESLLPHLANTKQFKEKIWKSYLKVHIDLYENLLKQLQATEARKKEIEEEARKQQTTWESVLDIFNDRFIVPFRLTAKNMVAVILGHDQILSVEFTFKDGDDTATVERNVLEESLSQGEKKALYILNIIFEVETRKAANQDTVFVFDDIADSFDYKNKYAIIQYLHEINENPRFKQIIMTHNFDFFRTIHHRFVPYPNCRMAFKRSTGLTIGPAEGIRNVFVKDWRDQFFKNARKRIASIPFVRNIIEYTRGEKDPDYVKLTSLLHWKKDTPGITEGELDAIYSTAFQGQKGKSANSKALVIDSIRREANECLQAQDGVNLENKIVLSIAIRLSAEAYMLNKIKDDKFVAGSESNQTVAIFEKYKNMFSGESKSIEVIQRGVLMTPENIHLNSFMYEPIVDMSDEHLKKLYGDVLKLGA